MIQASELRIGNWIKHADNGVWVPEYVGKPLMVSIDELTTIDNDEKQDYYEPIEITPEILEAAGLRKWDKNEDVWMNGGCDFEVTYSKSFHYYSFYLYSETDGSRWHLKNIKFLHELQNCS